MPSHAQWGRKSVELSMSSEFGAAKGGVAPASYPRERLDVTVARIRSPASPRGKHAEFGQGPVASKAQWTNMWMESARLRQRPAEQSGIDISA
jgi:hypothetical protein